MKRKLLCGLLAALTLTCATVKAAPSRVVPVQVDGTVLSQGVNYLQSGVTYVPLRGLLDAFGGWSVWWDSSRKVAAAASGSQSVTANPSRNTVTVNGRTYSGKVFVERGRTYIPLRTLATALGGSVAWDPQLGGAAVTSPGADHNAMDLYWLSRIISAESRGENMTGQIAVGNVHARLQRHSVPAPHGQIRGGGQAGPERREHRRQGSLLLRARPVPGHLDQRQPGVSQDHRLPPVLPVIDISQPGG